MGKYTNILKDYVRGSKREGDGTSVKISSFKSALKEGFISDDLCTKKGLAWILCMVGAGIAGSLVSKLYQGYYSNFIHGYGHDAALPFMAYWICRGYGGICRGYGGGKLASSLSGFLGCSLFEFAQYLGTYPGTYDPNDFIAYATGIGLALTVDKLAFGKHKRKTLEEHLKNEQKAFENKAGQNP